MKKYIVKVKSKTTSKYLLEEGCPEWIEVTIGEFENLKNAAEYCRQCNKHLRKFHSERIGKQIHFVEKVKNV